MERFCLLLVQKSRHDQNLLDTQPVRHIDLILSNPDVRAVSQIIKLIDACHFHIIIPKRLVDPVKIRTEPPVFNVNATYAKVTARAHDLIQRPAPLRLVHSLYHMVIKY